MSLVLSSLTSSVAGVYYHKEEALKLAFPQADTIRKEILFLDKEDKLKVEALARVKLESRIYIFYLGQRGEEVLGYALFGARIVKTRPIVYMIVIEPGGVLSQVQILASYEPEEHLPPRSWFDEFRGKILDDKLWPKRGISAVSGATLSVHNITQEARKALAIFQIMIQKK